MISQEALKDRLSYSPETGVFIWKNPTKFSNKKAGTRAGCYKHHGGYIVVQINGEVYQAQRLAWVYVYGGMPATKQIDHINHNKQDNRIKNLKLSTRTEIAKNKEMNKNNTSGHAGVVKTRHGRWRAQIWSDGIGKTIGTFKKIEDAIKARKKAEQEKGFHVNHGKKLC